MRKKRSSRLRRVVWRSVWVFTCMFILLFVIPELLVCSYASDRVFDTTQELPKNKVGLLLGTSERSSLGPNPYFYYRIDATVQLFNEKKIDYILVTGDNGTTRYNEPTDMRDALVKRGIPTSKIVLDYAGFRTLDSVVRCKEIFGQDQVTIISQQFHNERALYISKWKGLDAVAFNADAVKTNRAWKVLLRERFARVKMMLDLILGTEPKFLGKKEPI